MLWSTCYILYITGIKELFLMVSPQNGKMLPSVKNNFYDHFFSSFILMTFHQVYTMILNCFADGTSLFSEVHNVDASHPTLNNDLVKIQEWAYNWKMFFNRDRNKQFQKVTFSRKTKKSFHPNIYFNNQSTERSVAHKHLRLTWGKELSFTN